MCTKLPDDELVKCLEVASPKPWQRQMAVQDFDPTDKTSNQLLAFFERMEACKAAGFFETRKKPAKGSNKNNPPNDGEDGRNGDDERGSKRFPNRTWRRETAKDALDGADLLAIATEWKEFRSPDFSQLKQKLTDPVIFDGRNLYDPDLMATLGITYYGIGRGQSVKDFSYNGPDRRTVTSTSD